MSIDIGWDADTLGEIELVAKELGIPRRVLLALALQEGGAKYPYVDNVAEKSYGPFQIYTVVHGGDKAKWIGANGREAVRNAATLMGWRWVKYWDQAAYERNDVQALYEWEPKAQGSIQVPWASAVANLQLADEYWKQYDAQVNPVNPHAECEARLQAAVIEARKLVYREVVPLFRLKADGLDDLAMRASVQAQNARELADNYEKAA